MSLLRPRFIETPAGRLFLQGWFPERAPAATVLVLPPFAEEMNKSRPQIAALGRRLASTGYALLLPDWRGTGDSDGDFAEATVTGWQQDLEAVHHWAAGEGLVIRILLGIRFGALLAANALANLPNVDRLLLWQPVPSGEAVLTQLLRTRVAAAMMSDVAGKESVAGLQALLAAGQPVEAAGYEISPVMAAELRQLALPAALPAGVQVNWLDLVGSEQTPVSRPAARLIERWQAAGTLLDHTRLIGEPFWTSTEISLSEALLTATLEGLVGPGDPLA